MRKDKYFSEDQVMHYLYVSDYIKNSILKLMYITQKSLFFLWIMYTRLQNLNEVIVYDISHLYFYFFWENWRMVIKPH